VAPSRRAARPGRFGVALHGDQAAQHRAMFAGDFLPDRLALVRPNGIVRSAIAAPAISPAVIGHADIAELGPAVAIDPDPRCADKQVFLKPVGPARFPPLEISRMPAFQCPAQARVLVEPTLFGSARRNRPRYRWAWVGVPQRRLACPRILLSADWGEGGLMV